MRNHYPELFHLKMTLKIVIWHIFRRMEPKWKKKSKIKPPVWIFVIAKIHANIRPLLVFYEQKFYRIHSIYRNEIKCYATLEKFPILKVKSKPFFSNKKTPLIHQFCVPMINSTLHKSQPQRRIRPTSLELWVLYVSL